MPKIKWSCVTREERFFTSFLFHDLLQNADPFWKKLNKQIGLSSQIKVDDVGFEVCFFRDTAVKKLISKREPELEKQTFDLVLWLSDQSMVIIEAKAQQGFHLDQINTLCNSRKIMLDIATTDYPIKEIYLVGLYSSKYKLKDSTKDKFRAIIHWSTIADLYPPHEKEYKRADKIYRDTNKKSEDKEKQ